MNFLALVALLSALGMYALARYVRHSKTAEATSSVTAIAGAAATFYDTSDANQPAGTKPDSAKAMRHFPPSSKGSVPADMQSVKGQRYQSTKADWSVSPWRELQFSINQPQYYVYTFEADGAGSGAKATVMARGDLDADGRASTFKLAVTADDAMTAKIAPTIERIDPEE
jgi:type IV pilus assembly protein PilA